jgi:competence protein ComEA
MLLSQAMTGERSFFVDRDSLYDLKQRIGAGKLGAPAIIACAIIAIVVAVYAGTYLYDAANAHSFAIESQNQESASSGSIASSSDASASATDGLGTSSEPAPVLILIDVEGAVDSPGIVSVPEDARVNDAVAAAGGLSDEAAPGALNLAQKVHDGEQIFVPTLEQASASSAEAQSAGAATAGSTASSQAPAKVNINTADEAALQTVTGIGPSTAKKIVADRTKNGPFASVDDLTRVSGIGEKKLEAFRDQLCV